jgi:hypothetical protein
MPLTTLTKVNWRRCRNWRKSWKPKRKSKNNTVRKKKEGSSNFSASKRTTNRWMKRWTKWRSASKKLRANTSPIYSSSKICKTNTKMRRKSYWILFVSRRKKSKNSVLFWIYSWLRNKFSISSIILNGIRKKNNGLFPSLLIAKRIWDCLNLPPQVCQRKTHRTTKEKKKK